MQGGAPVRNRKVGTNKSNFTFGLMNGGYLYIVNGDYKPTYNYGGTTLCELVVALCSTATKNILWHCQNHLEFSTKDT